MTFSQQILKLKLEEKRGPSQRWVPIDVVFSVDSSGSMRRTDPDKLRISSAKSFADKLNPSMDQAAVVSWTDKLEFKLPLSSNFDLLKSELDKVVVVEPTDVNLAIREAFDYTRRRS